MALPFSEKIIKIMCWYMMNYKLVWLLINHLYWMLTAGFKEELTGGLRGWIGMLLLGGNWGLLYGGLIGSWGCAGGMNCCIIELTKLLGWGAGTFWGLFGKFLAKRNKSLISNSTCPPFCLWCWIISL